MRVVIQRASRASIKIDHQQGGSMDAGLVILVGFEDTDEKEDIHWMTRKILNLRIFDDENGVMNKSVEDIKGGILVVSQFTLHASTRKGNRPSYIRAAKPDTAIPLYEEFLAELKGNTNLQIETGKFGAFMEVEMVNDGPVTITIDSKNKE
jgi:D-tyrosyl-tRNA(Tyr) deacylase